jgi:hypothetical protein
MNEPKKPEESVESPSPEKLTESDLSQVGGGQVVGSGEITIKFTTTSKSKVDSEL